MGYQRKLWVEEVIPHIFTAAEIRDMSMEEYAKHRAILLAEASASARAQRLTLAEILNSTSS